MRYIGKKFVTMLITILLVSFFVFVAFAVIPGDPALSKLGTEATYEKLEALREEMGLNEPLLKRYGTWIVGFFTGDMGTSYSYDMPVKDMILDKLPITITLTVMSFLMRRNTPSKKMGSAFPMRCSKSYTVLPASPPKRSGSGSKTAFASAFCRFLST